MKRLQLKHRCDTKRGKNKQEQKRYRNVAITFIKCYVIICQTCLCFWLLSALVPLMEDFGRKVLEVVWTMK